MSDMRSRGEGFSEIARALSVRPQDVQDLMLGIVTFAMQGQGPRSTRSAAGLGASLAPVTDLSARRSP